MKYLLYASLVFTTTFATAEPKAALPEKHFTFLENYCLDCHDTDTQKGKIDLERLSFNLGSIESAEMWQKVLNTLNSGEMPPEKKEQPVPAEKETFLADLSQQLVIARKLLADTGGEITMRRLNRREYENTIEALLGTLGGALRELAGVDAHDDAVNGRAGRRESSGALRLILDHITRRSRLDNAVCDRDRVDAMAVLPLVKAAASRLMTWDVVLDEEEAELWLRRLRQKADHWTRLEGRNVTELCRVRHRERLDRRHAGSVRNHRRLSEIVALHVA